MFGNKIYTSLCGMLTAARYDIYTQETESDAKTASDAKKGGGARLCLLGDQRHNLICCGSMYGKMHETKIHPEKVQRPTCV